MSKNKKRKTKAERKQLQASRMKCLDCGAEMRASRVGREWMFICTVDPYHRKRKSKRQKNNRKDAMFHLVGGSYCSGRGGR